MDTFIVSKIADYFSTSRNLRLSKELKNKTISKVLMEKCYKSTGYVIYPSEKGMKVVRVPSKIEKSDFPELNYDDMISKGIKNYMFYYTMKSKSLHAFQLLPHRYIEIKVEEDLEETCFFEVTENSFWLVVNHVSAYFFQDLKQTKKVRLEEGFFFDEVLLDDKLHSDFFGKELIVKDLVTEDVYRLPFLGETYYDIISKDMILIDFSFADKVLEDVLPKDDLPKEDRRNCLFKFHLVKGSPNKINLEFIKYLDKEIKPQRFCPKNGFFWSRNDEDDKIFLFCKDKLIKEITIEKMDDAIAIEQLDDEKILIEYEDSITTLDFATGTLDPKIDMKKNIDRLKFLGHLEKAGDYYHVIVIVDDDEIGEWKQFVLDQSFHTIYEIVDDKYYFYTD